MLALEGDGLLDILQHPNESKYPNQRIFIVAFNDYTYLVPFVEKADYYFLKTIIPSRKATRDYLAGGNNNEK
ncbi:toxin [Geobacter sp. OR-1]|uniref:toxin n=1 Tax=Geobacter sp. OR-1 TaxID=1266765 RepID=UPI001ED9C0EF|nr:toxin [Geobacter sp. OR-1]